MTEAEPAEELVLTTEAQLQDSSLCSEANAWIDAPIGTPMRATMSLPEWEVHGHHLAKRRASLTWKIVDWLMHAERMWPNSYQHYAEACGYSKHTLYSYSSIGSRVAEARRVELPFWYHRFVASMPVDSQRILLNACAERHLSYDAFKALVEEFKAISESEDGAVKLLPRVHPPSDDVIDSTFVPSITPVSELESAVDNLLAAASTPAPEEPAADAGQEDADRGAEDAISALDADADMALTVCASMDIECAPKWFDPPHRPHNILDVIYCLCRQVKHWAQRAAALELLASETAAARSQADAALATCAQHEDRIIALTAQLEAARAAVPLPTSTLPAGPQLAPVEAGEGIIVNMGITDKPYVDAITKWAKSETGSTWTAGGAIARALEQFCEMMSIKVSRPRIIE